MVAVTPIPSPTTTPTPAPSPTASPTPVAALTAPTLTASPAQPLAVGGGTSFAAPGGGAQLPFLLTAVGTEFGGDAVTTQMGGVLQLAPDGALRATFNNGALGATNLSLTASQPVGNGLTFSAYGVAGGSSARRFSWLLDLVSGNSVDHRAGGVAVAGFATPRAAVPLSGTGNFAGGVGGLVSEFHIPAGAGFALLLGNASVDANFSAGTLSGSLTQLRLGTDGFYVTGGVNTLTFTASFDAARNVYVGQVVAGTSPGGPNAFVAGASGAIVLQLFGPDAREVAGVFTLSDGNARLIGTLTVTR